MISTIGATGRLASATASQLGGCSATLEYAGLTGFRLSLLTAHGMDKTFCKVPVSVTIRDILAWYSCRRTSPSDVGRDIGELFGYVEKEGASD